MDGRGFCTFQYSVNWISFYANEFQAQGPKSGTKILDPCYASNLTTCRVARNYLRVIVDPDDPDVDIVAVHGLNPTNIKFHAEETWTSGDKIYNSNVAFETSTAGVREQAVNLLNRIDSKRENVNNRPIIFVAHSLGGIIVKRALVEAKNDDSYQHIRKATYGISFFGTPHQGGNLAGLGDIAASIIVDQKSATLGLAGKRERIIHLDAHHGDICRFASADGDNYEQVSFNLVRLVKSAIKESESHENDFPAHEKPAFIVPYNKNHDFVGRQEILQRLQSDLKIDGNRQKRVALFGLGGVGKSQIAINFVFWHRKNYPNISIFWIHSSSIERFREGYTAIARDRQLPGSEDPNVDHLSLVKTWLSSRASGRWLMIIDNSDEDDLMFGPEGTTSTPETVLMDQYIPTSSRGAVLMTTRNRIVAQKFTRGGSALEITFLDEESAVKLFHNFFKGKELPAGPIKDLVVKELECLPLAIAQASAFIQQNSMTVRGYLKYLRKSEDIMATFLKQEFNADGRDKLLPNAVTTTWILSFDHIEKTHSQATDILKATICLDRRNIPVSVLLQGKDGLEFLKSLGLLDAFSMITLNEEEGIFTMHKLVHLAIRGWLKQKNEYQSWAKKCSQTVLDNFPKDLVQNLQNFDLCGLHLPHGRAAADTARALPGLDGLVPQLSFWMSRCHNLRGEYEAAAEVFNGVIEWSTREYGEAHSQTIMLHNELAVQHSLQEKHQDAETVLRRIVKLCVERRIKHCEFAIFQFNLAVALRDQEKFDEAETILRQLLKDGNFDDKGRRQEYLRNMMGLVTVLTFQDDKLEEAEALGRKALILSETFEADKVTILTTKSSLSIILNRRAKFAESKTLGQEVIAMSEGVYGLEHRQTVASRFILAVQLYSMEDFEGAEQMFRLVFVTSERLLGSNHQETLVALYHLATSLVRLEELEESAQLFQRACPGLAKTVGREHEHAVNCAEKHKSLLERMEKRKEKV